MSKVLGNDLKYPLVLFTPVISLNKDIRSGENFSMLGKGKIKMQPTDKSG